MYSTSSSSGNGIFLCCDAWARWIKSYRAKDSRKTVRLAKGLEAHGFNVEQKHFFDTITIDVGPMQNVILKSASSTAALRKDRRVRIGISLDERTRPAIIEAVWRSFGIKRKDRDLTSGVEFFISTY